MLAQVELTDQEKLRAYNADEGTLKSITQVFTPVHYTHTVLA